MTNLIKAYHCFPLSYISHSPPVRHHARSFLSFFLSFIEVSKRPPVDKHLERVKSWEVALLEAEEEEELAERKQAS